MRFGIQLYPPCTAPEMAAYAKKALEQYAFDKVWVPDHLTYENVFVILAAIISPYRRPCRHIRDSPLGAHSGRFSFELRVSGPPRR